MASAIVTLKLMPESPETDMDKMTEDAKKKISDFTEESSEQIKVEKEPIAFGLVALKLMFVIDEDKGLPDSFTEDLESIENVSSVEVVDFRRALG